VVANVVVIRSNSQPFACHSERSEESRQFARVHQKPNQLRRSFAALRMTVKNHKSEITNRKSQIADVLDARLAALDIAD
jgi:hypothetical protein